VNAAYCRWLNDPEINKYLETRFSVQTQDTIKMYVRQMNRASNQIFLAICLEENDHHVGNIKFSDIDWNHKRAFLSLIIGEKGLWGRGFATEAIELMVRYGFETVGLNKIEPCCYDANKGALRLFKKTGFSVEGELRETALFEDNLISVIWFGLTRREWQYRHPDGVIPGITGRLR
jgi:[ribosomal protein S5]-alanine N-acetyltransferase